MVNQESPQLSLHKISQKIKKYNKVSLVNINYIYKIVNNLANISQTTGLPHNIPKSNTDKFVGRERELQRLHQQLQIDHEVLIAAVKGMEGIGKTELVIQYSLLHLHLQTYPGGICWIQATEQDIGLQIIRFAQKNFGLQPPEDLDLQQRVYWCWNHWHQKNTLVVIDDVKSYTHIKPLLPPKLSQFKVIIITKINIDLTSSLFLNVLSQSDALQFLTQFVGKEKVTQESTQAKELIRHLGYLPLALQLVGRYMKKYKISFAEILRRLKEKGLAHSFSIENNSNLNGMLGTSKE
jgi:hypothetical protein